MMNKEDQTPIRKRKFTPLFILSKIAKNNQITDDRQSVFSMIETEKKKINYRYSEMKRPRRLHTQGVNTSNNQEQTEDLQKKEGLQANNSNNSSMSKIQMILRRQPNTKGFNSVGKKLSRQNSPYLNQKRKRLLVSSTQNEISSFKSKIMNKLNDEVSGIVKTKTRQPEKRLLQPQFQICSQLGDKIFNHWKNIHLVNKAITSKKTEKQIIYLIKSFVLSEESDSSELEKIYTEDLVKQKIKKVLYLEKFLIILIVDFIILKKWKICQVISKSSLHAMCRFYALIIEDLINGDKINTQQIAKIQPELLVYIKENQELEQKQNSISYFFQSIQTKIYGLFKFSKQIQAFYKKSQKNFPLFNINLLYFKLLEFYSWTLLNVNCFGWDIEFLEVCPSPYLHYQPSKKYTLALDLDETLIHYKIGNVNHKSQFLIRPYLFQFLDRMAQHYEIGIFTCSLPEYADVILNHLNHIQFRLYRHHTVKLNGEHIKDLSRVGRDLKHILLVDNLEHNYRLQKMNGIHIRSWYGDKNDSMLVRLGDELEKLAKSNPQDLRQAKFERKFI